MSGMTMTQSIIAADLDAYENVMWFTSSYLIVMASLAPLVGRLAMIFSPGNLVLGSAIFFAAGAIASSQARTFGFFVFGRVLTGVGGGGVITLSMILILQLTSKKRRGVFIGLTNAVRPGTSHVPTIQFADGQPFRDSPLDFQQALLFMVLFFRPWDGYVPTSNS
jgi:MFS family permease